MEKISEKQKERRSREAQTAIEYLILLGVMVTIVLVGFKVYLHKAGDEAGNFFNAAAIGIMDEAPDAMVVNPARVNYP